MAAAIPIYQAISLAKPTSAAPRLPAVEQVIYILQNSAQLPASQIQQAFTSPHTLTLLPASLLLVSQPRTPPLLRLLICWGGRYTGRNSLRNQQAQRLH